MAKRQRQRSSLDPAVAAELGIDRPQTYEERKQEYDRDRVRLRLDVPAWLKETIEQEADGQRVSMSQFSGFLLAYALKLYLEGDGELVALLDNAKTPITSLRWAYGLELADLEEMIARSADGSKST